MKEYKDYRVSVWFRFAYTKTREMIEGVHEQRCHVNSAENAVASAMVSVLTVVKNGYEPLDDEGGKNRVVLNAFDVLSVEEI